MKKFVTRALFAALGAGACVATAHAGSAYQNWTVENYAIQQSLGGLKGDPVNGRKVAIDRGRGNCLACHQMPIEEEEFHGTLAPPLVGVGSRYDAGQLRIRVVDIKQINPNSLMPSFYKHPDKFNRVKKDFAGKTVLTAQEVEDVVAYLTTLK